VVTVGVGVGSVVGGTVVVGSVSVVVGGIVVVGVVVGDVVDVVDVGVVVVAVPPQPITNMSKINVIPAIIADIAVFIFLLFPPPPP
jgi:hypothetical protein